MSNEIKYISGFQAQKGSLDVQAGFGGVNVADMTGDKSISAVLDLTTSYEAIPTGDLGTLGMAYFENLGTQNIEIREDNTGNGHILLKPAEGHSVRLGADMQTPYAKASASTSQLFFLIIED